MGFTAGGGADANARLLARHYGRHIPGNPNIVVENMPGASSLKSVQYLEEAAKDGTVITEPSSGLVTQSQTDPKKFPIGSRIILGLAAAVRKCGSAIPGARVASIIGTT